MAGPVEPTNLFLLGQQAREAKTAEDWASARGLYLQALEIAPQHPIVFERLAETEVRLGDYDSAVGHLETLARLGGTSGQIDQDPFKPLVGHPGFAEVAGQIRDNSAPQESAEIFVVFEDNRLSPEGLDSTGRQALTPEHLSCGLPPGLDPYTSAVGEGVVYVTASPPIGSGEDLENAPFPAIVRLPL